MKWGKVDFEQLKRLQKNIDKLAKQDRTKMCEEVVKELAARMLRKLIKRTPVGQYPKGSGKKGGTLRKGWDVGEVIKTGDTYSIEIINATEYASYVNNGHRTRNHTGWVPRSFFC